MPLRLLLSLASCTALFAAACSTSAPDPATDEQAAPDAGDAGDAGYVEPPEDPLRRQAITVACEKQAAVKVERYPDLATAKRACWVDFWAHKCVADGMAPGSTITADFVDRCTAALRGRDRCLVYDPIECVPPPGARPLGASCLSPHQCASGYCPQRVLGISRSVSFEPGVCTLPHEPVQFSQFCFCPLGTSCKTLKKPTSGLYWSVSGDVLECQPPDRERARYDSPHSSAGDACSNDGDCEAKLRCVDGLCSGVAAGKSCYLFFDCDPALTCDTVCWAPTLAIGDACPNGNGICPPDSFCTGTCTRRPRLGESCTTTTPSCWGPRGAELRCRDGVCAPATQCPIEPPDEPVGSSRPACNQK